MGTWLNQLLTHPLARKYIGGTKVIQSSVASLPFYFGSTFSIRHRQIAAHPSGQTLCSNYSRYCITCTHVLQIAGFKCYVNTPAYMLMPLGCLDLQNGSHIYHRHVSSHPTQIPHGTHFYMCSTLLRQLGIPLVRHGERR